MTCLQKKSFNLAELASITGSQLIGNEETIICGLADLEEASSSDASFYANPRYEKIFRASKAGVIFIKEGTPTEAGKNYLINEYPSRAFQTALDIFFPPRKFPSAFLGIHPTAIIHPSAVVEQNVTVGPYVVIDEQVKIGNDTFIGAGTYIGPSTRIGHSCLIHPRVVIRENCLIGNHVVIQPGAVIGSCGFGFTADNQGKHTKLNHVGNVEIEDDVEIGANTTIDRSRFKSTRIGQGSKIDNLVQIAHSVILGSHNIIAAQTGFAGSTSTGKGSVFGGQVGVAGHLNLGSGVIVAGKSGVTKSLTAGKYGGNPAVPLHDYNRNQVFLRRIEQFVSELKLLQTQANHK